MQEIPLTKGKVALVDDEDFERVSQYSWSAYQDSTNGRWYARRTFRLGGKQVTQRMHQFIMGLEIGDPRHVDHKDRVNTLDNRRSNLRIATRSQNMSNRGRQKNNTTGFKGVRSMCGRWQARIRVANELVHLGTFPSPELAAVAYDAAAKNLHGEFAVTNTSLGLLTAA